MQVTRAKRALPNSQSHTGSANSSAETRETDGRSVPDEHAVIATVGDQEFAGGDVLAMRSALWCRAFRGATIGDLSFASR